MKLSKQIKKAFKSKYFWFTELFIAGFFLGLPFFVSGKSFIDFISELKDIKTSVFIILITVGLGLFIELYVRKRLK